jgi:hypothetical protein
MKAEVIAGYCHDACWMITACTAIELEQLVIERQAPCATCGGLFPLGQFIKCWKLEEDA